MNRIYIAAAISAAFAWVDASAQTPLINKLTECEKQEGFSLLYDGTLNSFKANFVDYIMNNTTNTNLSSEWSVNAATGAVGIQNNTEDVRSKKIYKDFDLRMDYRCSANEGVFYRTLVNTDRAWQTGIEVAINNYTNQNKDAPGAAYDLYPPNPNTYYLHNTGKWNSLRIVAKADSIEHWMNGTKVVGFKLHSPGFWAAYSQSKWNSDKRLTFKTPGNQAGGYIEQGYLGFQADHGGAWEIRTLRINEAPIPGPIKPESQCVVNALEDNSAGPALSGYALRRSQGGLSLGLAGGDVSEARLLSLDGRAWIGSLAGGEARFAGAFRSGVYVARLKTASGEVTRTLNLL